jgi:hypothetical protein
MIFQTSILDGAGARVEGGDTGPGGGGDQGEPVTISYVVLVSQ